MSAALLGATIVNAAPASPVSSALPLVTQASPSSDDDEDDPAPAAATPAATTPVGTPASTTPAVTATNTPTAVESDAAVANPDAQKLVSGAPLYNPNVAVHIVEQKAHSDSGKFEIVLYPAAVQVNGKFTQHIGTMASLVYHLQENFGIQLTGGYNWYNVESAFNGELVDKFNVEAQAATSLLWTWGVLAGVEVTPFYGKFSLFEGTLAHFSFVLNGGLGAGGTRHQLTPERLNTDGSVLPGTYGDTGVRFMGSLGAGFRLQLGDHVAIRLEVKDVLYTARMEQVNGCNLQDLTLMDSAVNGGSQDFSNLNVSSSCKVEAFSGTNPDTNRPRSGDIPLAKNLVQKLSSDVLNNVGLYLGVSFLF